MAGDWPEKRPRRSARASSTGYRPGMVPHGASSWLTCRAFYLFIFLIFLLGTQPYKETCGDKHKTRHRGCRDDVPMYREQLDRPGVSALALQPAVR